MKYRETMENSAAISFNAVESDENTANTADSPNCDNDGGDSSSLESMKDNGKKTFDRAVPDSVVALGMLEYIQAQNLPEVCSEETTDYLKLPKPENVTIKEILDISDDFFFDEPGPISVKNTTRSVVPPVRVRRFDVPKDIHIEWDDSSNTSEVDFEPDSSGTLHLEDRIMNFIFPYAPRTARGMVSLMFWHSFMLTVTAPLVRLVKRRWRTELFVHTLSDLLLPSRVTSWFEDHGIIHPGTEYPEEGDVVPGVGPVVGIDMAFALHAFFGLLWMTSGYITICHAHKFHRKGHKYAGYVSALTFAGHCCAAAYCLYTDVVRHTAVPKLILFYVLVSSISKFLIAMKFARNKSRGWMNKHMDFMVDCYITSLAGAGPTRFVSQVQYWLGSDPSICANKYGGMASQCQVSYVNRLYWIGLFLAYMVGMYVKGRKSKELTLRYIVNTSVQLSFCAVVFAMSMMPNAEEYLHAAFGEPRTTRNNIFATVGALFIIADGAFFYKLTVQGRPPLWKRLLENLKKAKALACHHNFLPVPKNCRRKVKKCPSSDLLLDLSIHGLGSNH